MPGWLCAMASLLFSAAAFTAQSLYGSWHWRLIRLRREHLYIPHWLNWTVIDGLHLVAMALALCSFIYAILAVLRRSLVLGVVALAISGCVGFFAMLIA